MCPSVERIFARAMDLRAAWEWGHEHQKYSEVHPEHVFSSSTTNSTVFPMKPLAAADLCLSAIAASSRARARLFSSGITSGIAAAAVPGR